MYLFFWLKLKNVLIFHITLIDVFDVLQIPKMKWCNVTWTFLEFYFKLSESCLLQKHTLSHTRKKVKNSLKFWIKVHNKNISSGVQRIMCFYLCGKLFFLKNFESLIPNIPEILHKKDLFILNKTHFLFLCLIKKLLESIGSEKNIPHYKKQMF